jgi:hypothetical protein
MLSRRLALTLAFASSLAASRVRGQQAATEADSTARPAIPAAEAARAGIAPSRVEKRDRLPLLFYGALGAAATTAAVLRVDPDSGGYRDGWATATDFPDKAVHALAAWAITTVGVDLGARPRYAAAAVCAAGTAFEFAQGYVSVYDVAADCVGAAGAAAWQSWRAKRRARRR